MEEELAKEAEEAAKKGEQIRDKQGQLLTTEKDQEPRWVEHFKEVLNRPAPEQEPDIPEAEEDLSVDIGPPKKKGSLQPLIL